MIVEFTGYSDDVVTIEVFGADRILITRDEVYVNSDAPFTVQTFDASRACHVYAHYWREGCWHFGVALVAEVLPPWRFTVEQAHQYSTRLVIDTGDDTVAAPRRDRD
ncbi:MAG: hypothetical protein ACTHU0_16235 [Kofleriaceae bacterium]